MLIQQLLIYYVSLIKLLSRLSVYLKAFSVYDKGSNSCRESYLDLRLITLYLEYPQVLHTLQA